MNRVSVMFLLILLFGAGTMKADEIQTKIGIYEKLDEYIPKGLSFINDRGEKIILDEHIDKPTVLVLVYYNCPGICSPLLDGVARVIDETDLVLGEDYQVETISFNWEENWELGRDKKKNYVAQIKKEINADAWDFMTGDSATIMKLVDAVGFGFKKEGKDFVHAGAIIVLSPDAKVTRYLYGISYLPFDFKLALVEAARGQSGPTINKVLSYCFSYDAEGKKYVFNIAKVSATVILFFAFSLLLYLFITRKRKHKSHI